MAFGLSQRQGLAAIGLPLCLALLLAGWPGQHIAPGSEDVFFAENEVLKEFTGDSALGLIQKKAMLHSSSKTAAFELEATSTNKDEGLRKKERKIEDEGLESWTKQTNKYCSGRFTWTFEDLEEAENNCSGTPWCMGVYDRKCKGAKYHLCMTGLGNTTLGSCVYQSASVEERTMGEALLATSTNKDEGWTKQTNKYCSGRFTWTFEDLEEAENNCSGTPWCMGVYDHKCNGTRYHLCMSGLGNSSMGSCVYQSTRVEERGMSEALLLEDEEEEGEGVAEVGWPWTDGQPKPPPANWWAPFLATVATRGSNPTGGQ